MLKIKDKATFSFMALTLWVFWIVITASFQVQSLLLGAVLALCVALFNYDLFFKKDERSQLNGHTLFLLLRYGLRLGGSIILASLQVAYMALHPALPISPGTVRFPLVLKKELNKVVLANSITLTPGTLTVLVEEDEIMVHALTEKNARSVVEWSLIKELADIEKEQEEERSE